MKKHKLFPISKPYGYYPVQVDAAIAKYNDVILQLQDALTNRDRIIEMKDEEMRQIKGELTRMQLEMSMLEIPKMDSVQEHMILTQFQSSKTGVKETEAFKAPPPPQQVNNIKMEPVESPEIMVQLDEPSESESGSGFEIIE